MVPSPACRMQPRSHRRRARRGCTLAAVNDSVDDRIARARQRLRSATSEAERRDAMLDEWRATLEAFARACRASAVSPASRVAKVRVGAQTIERAIDELRELEPGERPHAVNAMRWIEDASQLRAVVRAARDAIDALLWIERLGQLDDRETACEIAGEITDRSNVELPSLIEAVYVHLGAPAAARFAPKARAAQSVIDEAGSADEIAWVASLLLSLPPDEARSTALALSRALEQIEREDPAYRVELDDPNVSARARVMLALAHCGEHDAALATLSRWADSVDRPTLREIDAARTVLSALAPELAQRSAAIVSLDAHERAQRAAQQEKLADGERAAFDPRSSTEALRAMALREPASTISSSMLARLDATLPALIEALSPAQRERAWDAIERCVDRSFFAAARVLAIAPSGRLRSFVARRFDALGGLGVIAGALRAMEPGEDRAWLARACVERSPMADGDESAAFAVATALDDERAAMCWLEARRGREIPRASLPPEALLSALSAAADRGEEGFYRDPPSRVLVAHLRGSDAGRAMLARCARAMLDDADPRDEARWNAERSTLTDLVRFADKDGLQRALALAEQRKEWWLGHAVIVRCRALLGASKIDASELARVARALLQALSFVPRETLTMALLRLASGDAASLGALLPEPPMDLNRWDVGADVRVFDVVDDALAWGALLPSREALEHGSRLWSAASDDARTSAIPWITRGWRSQRVVGAQCDPKIIAALPIETIVDVWARYGPAGGSLSLALHGAELRRMTGDEGLSQISEALFAALDQR